MHCTTRNSALTTAELHLTRVIASLQHIIHFWKWCLSRSRLTSLHALTKRCTHLVLGATDEGASASVENGIGGRGCTRGLLGDLVAQVLDQDLIRALVQHCEAIPRDEHC